MKKNSIEYIVLKDKILTYLKTLRLKIDNLDIDGLIDVAQQRGKPCPLFFGARCLDYKRKTRLSDHYGCDNCVFYCEGKCFSDEGHDLYEYHNKWYEWGVWKREED